MSGSSNLFSENWYLVELVRCGLRASVSVQRQEFHGELWYVCRDRFSNQFFRLSPQAYAFIARLDDQRTLDQLWQEQLDLNPDETPGQGEIIGLLTELNSANLLQFDSAGDSERLYQRHQDRQKKQRRSWLMGFMTAKIPLFDPDKLLTRLLPYCRWLFGPIGLLLSLLVGLVGLKSAIEYSDQLFDQAQAMLAPSNMILLYFALLLIKVFHEFGHGLVCKYYNGEVHTTGVLLLFLMPLPYVDATASWRFKDKKQRIYVAAAGVFVELFLAALSAIIWANTGPGAIHSVAYNVMFIASVSSLLFNANPLLKFDGYYVFSDFIEVPNLFNRSKQMLNYWWERLLYRLPNLVSPAHNTYEARWLTVYGVLATFYRIFITITIIGFVADQYLILGIIMALMLLVTWLVLPPIKLIKYLATSPKHARQRKLSVLLTCSAIGLPLLLLATVPVAERFRAPGVIESDSFSHVSSHSSGFLVKLLVKSGDRVVAGQPLIQLVNRETQFKVNEFKAKLLELKMLEQQSLSQRVADLSPIKLRQVAIAARLHEFEQELQLLTIVAEQAGIWVIEPQLKLAGTWIAQGQEVGKIVEQTDFSFIAIVSQEEAASLFQRDISQMEVRLYGQAGQNIRVKQFNIIPYQQQELPSASLGWQSGGQVAISADESGKQTLEPFFKVVAQLQQQQAKLLHGHTGKLRVTLDSRPLLEQWWRSLQQFLQQRYQL